MFLVFLLALLVTATVHAVISHRRSRQAVAELLLLYILVGYCGFAMFAVSAFSLIAGDRAAAWLGWTPNNPFQQFLSFALLGLATAAILSVRYRDTYLVGPVVGWSVFFAGATYGHLADLGQRGGESRNRSGSIRDPHVNSSAAARPPCLKWGRLVPSA